MTSSAILNGLSTRCLGRSVFCYSLIDSTNSTAKTLAEQGAEEGTLVVADEQIAGRGRLNRRWLAPPGTSLLFSLVFRPQLQAKRIQGLTMVCGLGVIEAIYQLFRLSAHLKWPNDIVLSRRKLGGILTEASTSGELVRYAVVGIGLNVNLDVTTLPAQFHATSIQHELGRRVPRVRLLQEILSAIETRYVRLRAGEWPARDWAAALETIGQWVELHTPTGTWRGLAEGIDEDGALCLRLEDGRSYTVWVGDIVPNQSEKSASADELI